MATSASDPDSPFAPMLWWSDLMTQALQSAHTAYAPQNLAQSILPWTFANSVTINEQNSGSPEAERNIVAQESYGRQLGRLTDALALLIEKQPEAVRAQPPMQALLEMRKKIEQIKEHAAGARLERLKADLARLKKDDPAAYRKLLAR